MMSADAWSANQQRFHALAEAMPSQLTIVGSHSKQVFNPPSSAPMLCTRLWSGIIEHDVDDQVVVVWAGTLISDLQAELHRAGQCLGLPATGHVLIDGIPGTVGGLIATNLVHGLSHQTRMPKDWTLGLCLVRADGTVARAGTKAVKSVAGYDIHRFMAGARGTLGLIAAAALRVFPLRGLPLCQSEALRTWSGEPVWIQRVAPADFVVARSSASHLFAADPASSTLWHASPPFRFTEDWVMGPGGECSPRSAPVELASRARTVLDPDRRFNPHVEP